MNKYSPAPWHETENDDGDVIVRMDEAHSVVVANLEGSCMTCHANARLIAAAPELLEACQAALSLAKEMSEGDLYDQINSAIKKATGES